MELTEVRWVVLDTCGRVNRAFSRTEAFEAKTQSPHCQGFQRIELQFVGLPFESHYQKYELQKR